jgi:hypothetical protein
METNNLIFKETIIKPNGENLIVKIRLNDECKNGHQDFAITADLYKGKGRSETSLISCGCLHDEILKYAPKYKKFVDLHLCDYDGVPMYAVSNGLYHMKEGFNDDKGSHEETFCNYYRITPKQYEELKKAKEKAYFGFLLVKLGITEQWKKEAKDAIKTLENLTGDTFINDSAKSQFEFTKEDLNLIEDKVK